MKFCPYCERRIDGRICCEKQRSKIEESNLQKIQLKRTEEELFFKSMPSKFISLYYIAHLENLSSILSHGICSRKYCEKNNLIQKSIHNTNIVNRRTIRIVEFTRTVTDFANLYFQPINAMLSNVFDEHSRNDILILKIHYNINQPGIFFTDGNAAKTSESKIFSSMNFDQEFPKIEQYLKGGPYYSGEGKWRQMAECLIPEKVPLKNIKVIHISQFSTSKNRLNNILEKNNLKLPIIQNEKILGASF